MEPVRLEPFTHYPFTFSICTLVTDHEEYAGMVASCKEAGFDDSEFIYADNGSGNRFDAYTAINRFIQEAKGKYVIICHQDILFRDSRKYLEELIGQTDTLDPDWAVLSNAGAVAPNYFSMLVSYPDGTTVKKGNPPQKLCTVDEHFILLKASANLAASADLKGFHFYGTDLCLVADTLGYSAYSIPFNILHKSKGKINPEFYDLKHTIVKKYNRSLRGRWIQTTITRFYISGSRIDRLISGNFLVVWFIKLRNSLKKKQERS
jgi:hypothetical protein